MRQSGSASSGARLRRRGGASSSAIRTRRDDDDESPEFQEVKRTSALTSERRGALVLRPDPNVPGDNLMFVLVIVGFDSARAPP